MSERAFAEAIEGFAKSTKDAIENIANALEAQEKDLAMIMELLANTSKVVIDLSERIDVLEKGVPLGNREA